MALKIQHYFKFLRFLALEIWINPDFSAGFDSSEIKKIIEHLCQDPDWYFKANPKKVIKSGKATTVIEADIGGEKMMIKRINFQGVLTMFRRMFNMSRVEKNWKFAHLLHQNELDTFRPMILVKNRILGINFKSYLYMSKIEGLEARHFFEKCVFKSQWQVIADKIILLIQKLNQVGLRHRDLNLSNMIVSQGKPYLIDLDAMKSSVAGSGDVYNKEIKKFIENIDYLKDQNNELFSYFYQALIKEKVL